MFARAFEAYVEDTILAKGRRSEYLVSGTTEKRSITRTKKAGPSRNRHDKTHTGIEIYPHGEDRKAINGAMMELFEALAASGHLKKALARLGWPGLFPLAKAARPGPFARLAQFLRTRRAA